MDLPGAMPEEVKDEIVDLIGCKREEIIPASGKTGMGVNDVLRAIVDRIPAPKGNPSAPLKALIFDSVFNSFRGIIAYYRILDGELKKGQHVKFMNTKMDYYAEETGVLKLTMNPRDTIKAGDVGYIISGIKDAKEVKVGDTITHVDRPCAEQIKGFEDVKPMVFAGIFPGDTEDYEELRYSMEKLQLNDASLTFEPESSAALGFGFRCGFLGMLHMEIIQERLEREFNMTVLTTVPNVSYHAYQTNGDDMVVNVTKTKKLTNVRSAGADDKARIVPAIKFSLEEALEYIQKDEYVEVTPNHLRLRKILLKEVDRKRNKAI
jgi:GTP-binding protein LepA